MLIGIDIGGTFTDLVFLSGQGKTMTFLKVPSTPDGLERGVVAGLRKLAEHTGLEFDQVDRVVHGTTAATNALLEGKWARTALITTEGFRDVIEIGRQNRAAIYDLSVERPVPIVDRDLRFEVPERLDYMGRVVRALDESEAERIAEEVQGRGVESVAVCLLFSYANPEHERKVRRILKSRLSLPITLSSEVLPEFREYERSVTVAINAALRPVIGDYLQRLEREAGGLGIRREWQIMQSNAGITGSKGAQDEPVKIVLSGPAAGVEGARFVGEQAGFLDLITLDMGGTSCDVSLVRNGTAAISNQGSIAGYPIRVPMVDIHTIGAGGGSVAWIDKGGALRVGPQSAGADPGPVCYGKGGRQPTVTDAHLVLGRLNAARPVGGLECLDSDSARKAIEGVVAGPLAMGVEEAAQGILAVAEANMERAIRVISVERGHDPRRFALLPFGGAGPLHGVSLAARLGISRVLVPPSAGVLSALGLLQTDMLHDFVQSVVQETSRLDAREIIAIYGSLRQRGRESLLRDGVAEEMICYRLSADMRYRGQSHELNLGLPDSPVTPESFNTLVERFDEMHRQVYGHASPGEPVELVNLRLRAVGLTENVDLRFGLETAKGEAFCSTRPVHFSSGGWLETSMFERDSLPAGFSVQGPAIIEGRESTVVVLPGWQASVDRLANLIIANGTGAR